MLKNVFRFQRRIFLTLRTEVGSRTLVKILGSICAICISRYENLCFALTLRDRLINFGVWGNDSHPHRVTGSKIVPKISARFVLFVLQGFRICASALHSLFWKHGCRTGGNINPGIESRDRKWCVPNWCSSYFKEFVLQPLTRYSENKFGAAKVAK